MDFQQQNESEVPQTNDYFAGADNLLGQNDFSVGETNFTEPKQESPKPSFNIFDEMPPSQST